jgi:hypothetical protein
MNAPPRNGRRFVALSSWLYSTLLLVCPSTFLREYGGEMAQVS